MATAQSLTADDLFEVVLNLCQHMASLEERVNHLTVAPEPEAPANRVAKAKVVPTEPKAPKAERCSAKAKSTGRRCKQRATDGTTVCFAHGGVTHLAKQAAADVAPTEQRKVAIVAFVDGVHVKTAKVADLTEGEPDVFTEVKTDSRAAFDTTPFAEEVGVGATVDETLKRLYDHNRSGGPRRYRLILADAASKKRMHRDEVKAIRAS